MIADYFVYRQRQLNVAALYARRGEYTYANGVSWVAVTALLAGALPSLPGFLASIKVIDGAHVPAFLMELYSFAWLAGFAIAFVLYLVLRKIAPQA
jgi:NCS1 family nucleobase:cation symporter-1